MGRGRCLSLLSLVWLVPLRWSYFVGTRSAIGSCNFHWKSRMGGPHRQRGNTYGGGPVTDGVPLSSVRCTRYLITCFFFSRVCADVASVFVRFSCRRENNASCMWLTDE